MTREAIVRAVREHAALFEMDDRGLLEVSGEDRVRWLDGMISGDVEALERRPEGAGCYATLLTNRGAIVADLHVGRLGETFVLESLRREIPRIQGALEKFVIADDVRLVDRSDEQLVLGLEGPATPGILEAVLPPGVAPPAPEAWCDTEIAGRAVRLAGFGFSGESACQLRLAADDREAVEAALDAAAGESGLLRGDPEALEILRVEAGIPLLGAELDEEVLPAEARLERAISTTKGCYVGQEIVARLRSRGQVNHLLVGLRLTAGTTAEVGAPLVVAGRATGEITSLVESPGEGVIALGYVRREHAEAGTVVEVGSGRAHVTDLPFVSLAGAVRLAGAVPPAGAAKP